MVKSLFKYLPELIILLISILANLAVLLNDLGLVQVPEMMLSSDISGVCLPLMSALLLLRCAREEELEKQSQSDSLMSNQD